MDTGEICRKYKAHRIYTVFVSPLHSGKLLGVGQSLYDFPTKAEGDTSRHDENRVVQPTCHRWSPLELQHKFPPEEHGGCRYLGALNRWPDDRDKTDRDQHASRNSDQEHAGCAADQLITPPPPWLFYTDFWSTDDDSWRTWRKQRKTETVCDNFYTRYQKQKISTTKIQQLIRIFCMI